MSAAKQFTETQIASGIAAAFEIVAAVRDAGVKDHAELVPMAAYAKAAEERDAALSAYRKAKNAHRSFAATHSQNDPAHEDHQRAVAVAQATLNSCEQILAVTHAEWRKARGL